LEVNESAQMAFVYKISKELTEHIIKQVKVLPSIDNRVMIAPSCLVEGRGDQDKQDWRIPLTNYLKSPVVNDKILKDKQ